LPNVSNSFESATLSIATLVRISARTNTLDRQWLNPFVSRFETIIAIL
jgi:hypothetical protein